MTEAEKVVNKCVKNERLNQLKKLYPNAILLPVITENKLPLAFAKSFGMKMHVKVGQISSEKRKSMSATDRLLHKPTFFGKIVKKQSYILVDDIVTQGGTISALRDFVVSKGGFVVAVTALACAAGASYLQPDLENILLLHHKFGLPNLLSILGLEASIDSIFRFTNAQIKHMLRFKDLSHFEKQLGGNFSQKSKVNFALVRLKICTSFFK